MRKKFLIRINLLLGVISLALAGCHATKKTVQDDRIRLMYGVPVEMVQQETTPADTVIPADTVKTPDTPPQPSAPSDRDIIVTKYGIPSSFY